MFNTLRKIQKYAQKNHQYLNYGGCGVFAYLVADKMQKLGYDVEIVTPVDEFYGCPANKIRKNVVDPKNVYDWDDNGLSRGHLAIRFKSKSGKVWVYDSESLYISDTRFGKNKTYRTSKVFGSGLTVEETKLISKKKDGWNCCFNRKEIPDLRKNINKIFKENHNV